MSVSRNMCLQAHRQGTVFEGFAFWPITDFIHCLHVAIHAVCGPLASLLMKITAVKTNLVVAMYPICSWRTSG